MERPFVISKTPKMATQPVEIFPPSSTVVTFEGSAATVTNTSSVPVLIDGAPLAAGGQGALSVSATSFIARADVYATLSISYTADPDNSGSLPITQSGGDERYILRTEGMASNTQTGTAYTLVLSDANKVIEMTNAGANTLTVPTNATVAFPIGTVIEVYQGGAGQTTIAAPGVTIRAPDGQKLAKQYSTASLRKRAADEWVLAGSTVL